MILVIKSEDAHIVGVTQIVHCHLRRPDRDVQIADAIPSRAACHAAGAVNNHNHCHRRHLIHTPKLHIHRQHCLQHCIPIAAKRKAVLPATADKTAAIILYIGLQIVQKLLRQIINVGIHQYD